LESGVFTVRGVSFKMMRVECGTFTMGDNESQRDDEKPAYEVTFTKDYYMGQTLVTQALWKAVMGLSVCHCIVAVFAFFYRTSI